jgi:hypothetical protein
MFNLTGFSMASRTRDREAIENPVKEFSKIHFFTHTIPDWKSIIPIIRCNITSIIAVGAFQQ